VNIALIPYTARRHVVMGMLLAAAGLGAWWWTLFLVVVVNPLLWDLFQLQFWSRTEGWFYLGSIGTVVAFLSVFFEGTLRRRALGWRFFWSWFGAMVTLSGISLGLPTVRWVLPLFTGELTDQLLSDPALLTLRYRLSLFLVLGVWSGVGPWCARRLHALVTRNTRYGGRDGEVAPPPPGWAEWFGILFSHVVGSVVAGLFAALAWHVPGYYDDLAGDLYVASALAAATFGGIHGLLVWPIPDDLYAGWIRVLSYERYGLRIPIPHTDGSPAERFLGHFPRGLDLYMPAEAQVMELHTSFVMDRERGYAVRGLSISPTVVKRTLERIDLRYDVRRPAPLETQLRMEDRILLGPSGDTEVEFLMLPKEER
jgi:hypothetical protein